MEENNKSNRRTKNWIERLHTRSWEMELLIVGFALIVLINIPQSIDRSIAIWTSTISSSYVSVLIYLAMTAKLGVYILMFNLIAHVFLRGFWIGIVGLNSVYPKGIHLDRLKFSKKFNNFYSRRLVSLDKYAVNVDNICSSIFAFTFLLMFIFFSLGIYCVFLVALLAILPSIFGLHALIIVIQLVIFLPFLIFGIIAAIDFISLGRIKRIKWLSKIYLPFFKIIRIITLSFLYESIYYTFITNMRKGAIGIIFLIYLSFVFFFAFTDYTEVVYYTDENTKYSMPSSSYENKSKNILTVNKPIIQSNIIQEGFIELFIPYDIKDNHFIELTNPSIVPFKKKGLSSKIVLAVTDDNDSMNKLSIDERSRLVLKAMNEFYMISIDDSLIEKIDFSFYKHPKNQTPGIYTVLFIDSLKQGKHMLSIEKCIPKTYKKKIKRNYYIPFWVK